MKYFPLFLILLFIFPERSSLAQYYDTGQDPARLKWLQIKTDKFTIIYPEKYGKEGIEFAKALDRSQTGVSTLFPEKKFRIPVLIHSFSTQSNGYVAWAPKRMELYPMPDQNSLPGDPNTLLAIHELTHVYQMESLNNGVTRALNYIIGEQSTGIMASLLPTWLMEGQAVFSETALSLTGRGRSPSFQKQVKAILLEHENKYKYDKIVNGSYRDFVPDIYQSGYQMITWAAISRDPSIWNKAISFSGEQPFMINPVNLSLRKNGNLTKKSLYNETFDTLTSIWSRNLSGTTTYEQLNPAKKKEYINYYSPVDAGNGIAAIKTSLSESPRFVLISNTSGKEKVIHRPGYMNPMLISYGAGMIVWVETRPDVRWENRDYSVIMIHDINSGTTRKISHHTRYPAASISADGKIICAIENTVDNSNSLVFIDAASGNIIKSVPSPGNAYLQRPQWSESSKITVISLTAKGEGILSYTTATGKWDVLKEESPEDLQSCFLRNDSLFYVSSVSGTENVYLQTRGGLKQITHSRFGATDPSLKGNRIIFSDYNSQGNSVCYTETGNATALSETADNEEFLIDKLKNKKDVTGIDISKNYKPQPYRKWQHLFRFHSWMPFYADIDRIQSDPLLIRPGITLMSQNTLSSLISTIGYEYTAEKRNVLHSKVSWKGWFPVFEATYDYGNYPAVFGTPRTIQPATNFSGGVILPFRFSTGRFSQFIRPSFTTYYTRDIYQVGDGVYDYEQTKLAGRLYLSNYSRYAARDIYPKWAQIIDLNYRFSPFDKQIFGTTAYVKTAFFFPGLFRDNGIRIRFEKEKQDQSKYIFGNSILFPRGLNTHIISRSLTFLSADYVFPVAYPDFNISSLFYLKRIRSGLFYDYASGTRNRYFNPSALHTNAEHFRSFGIELLGDFHLLRIPFMMSGGVQAAWKELGQAPHFGVLFNIDIYGFSVGKRQQ